MTGVLNGGAAVVAALVAEGVDVVFGIPGTHNLELYRALADRGVRHVTTRSEQGAGYAADGYARSSGRPGRRSGRRPLRRHVHRPQVT